MLLSLVLIALYKSADILKVSNKHLFNHLKNSSNALRGAEVLYMDILRSDGNISIVKKNKFHHIIINRTQNTLYQLNNAKIVWLIYKEKNQLLRIEGNKFNIPLKSEERVAIDKIADDMELFKVYRNKKTDKILVILKQIGNETQSFMVQNLPKPPKIIINFPMVGGNSMKKKH
jgi:hypothetical protein